MTRSTQNNDVRWSGFLLIALILSLLMQLSRMNINEPNGMRNRPADGNLFIQITGDVNSPGVYSFPGPVDPDKLISVCGGLKAECRETLFLTDINLFSGSRIDVTRNDDECVIAQKEMSAFHKVALGIPIDINRESAEGLTAIPGIGNSLASRIEAQRIKKKGFRDLEEIKDVPGIGSSLYEKIIPYITIQ